MFICMCTKPFGSFLKCQLFNKFVGFQVKIFLKGVIQVPIPAYLMKKGVKSNVSVHNHYHFFYTICFIHAFTVHFLKQANILKYLFKTYFNVRYQFWIKFSTSHHLLIFLIKLWSSANYLINCVTAIQKRGIHKCPGKNNKKNKNKSSIFIFHYFSIE